MYVCCAQECKKYLIQCAGVLMKWMSTLQYQDIKLQFISLAFMVQNDYGFQACVMNILTRLWIHIHDNTLRVLSLWQQELALRAKINKLPKWLILLLASINLLPARLLCVHSYMHKFTWATWRHGCVAYDLHTWIMWLACDPSFNTRSCGLHVILIWARWCM